jgi:hypothetical protein
LPSRRKIMLIPSARSFVFTARATVDAVCDMNQSSE